MKIQKYRMAILCAAVLALVGLAGASQSLAGFQRGEPGTVRQEEALTQLTWNLTNDFRLSPYQANPNPDKYGNAEVWHFMRTTATHNPSTYALNSVFYPNVGNHPGFQGWEGPEATGYPNSGVPEFALNTTGAPIIQPFELYYPPGAFVIHPASTQPAILGWHSPFSGSIAIEGGVTDICTGIGDGILWYIDKGATTLASGSYPNGGSQLFKNGANGNSLANIPVNQGDFIYLIVAPGSDYYCDGTGTDLTITMHVTKPAGFKAWNVTDDFRVLPAQVNPNPDQYGNPHVWSFMESATLVRDPTTYSLVNNYDSDVTQIAGLEGWVGTFPSGSLGDYLPNFIKNTNGVVQSTTATIPAGAFVVHPTPSKDAIIRWQSPYTGLIKVVGGVSDLDNKCGNGIAWFIDKGETNLASGSYVNGGAQPFHSGTGGSNLANIPVTQGDSIYLAVDPANDYYCDSTKVELTITMDVPTQIPTATFTPDGDWIYCSKQNATCALPAPRLVRYGANGRYIFKNLAGSFVCSTAFDSDPIPGVAKFCHYNKNAGAPFPTSTYTPTSTPTQTSTPTKTPTLTATSTATPTASVEACSKKPKDLEPADGAVVTGPEIVLKWRESGCAESYSIKIGRVSNGQAVVNKNGHAKPRYTFKEGVAGETYKWQVRACNSVGCGPWTTPRQFIIQP